METNKCQMKGQPEHNRQHYFWRENQKLKTNKTFDVLAEELIENDIPINQAGRTDDERTTTNQQHTRTVDEKQQNATVFIRKQTSETLKLNSKVKCKERPAIFFYVISPTLQLINKHKKI